MGLGLSLAALIISSGASYISIQNLLSSDRWVDHTFQVIQDMDNLLSGMKDAETGQRGYLLSGDEVFLQPYTGSRDEVRKYFVHVQLLTADNPSQQNDFPLLSALIEKKYALIDKTLANRKRGIPVTTRELLQGKDIMDSIRVQVAKMEHRERLLLETRTSKMNVFATYTPLLILFASIVAVIVTYAFYRRMRNNLNDNQKLQELLESKKLQVEKDIQVISDLAEHISKGNYDARIKDSDFK